MSKAIKIGDSKTTTHAQGHICTVMIYDKENLYGKEVGSVSLVVIPEFKHLIPEFERLINKMEKK